MTEAIAGVVWAPGLLDVGRVQALADLAREACEALGLCAGADGSGGWLGLGRLEGRGWDDPRWLELQAGVLGHPALAEVREDARLMGLLVEVMGGEVVGAQGDIVRVACPGQPELATRPHQDGFYIKDSATLWTAWVPLVPCPLELGPLAVRAATGDGVLHHDSCDLGVPALTMIAPPRIGEDGRLNDGWYTYQMKPGDALLFRSDVIHAALPNLTDRHVRASVDLRFRRA